MNRKEFAVLSDLIKNSDFVPRKEGDEILSTPEKMDRWYELLNDLNFDVAKKAVNEYAMTNKFAPTIADIREYAGHYNGQPHIPTAMEAWSIVSKALRNSTYNSEQEFAKLPPLVQKAVGSPVNLQSWATDENYNEPVLASQFMKDYRMVTDQAKEIFKLPERTQQEIAARRMETPQIEAKGDETQKYLSEKDKAVYGANKSDTPPTKPPENFGNRVLQAIGG